MKWTMKEGGSVLKWIRTKGNFSHLDDPYKERGFL